MQTQSVYDHLATGYLSPGRRSTTTVFRELQHIPIREFLYEASRRIDYFSAMKYLVVGAGPVGNIDELISNHRCIGSYLDETDARNITYLDASPVILGLCREAVSSTVRQLCRHWDPGHFVNGLAEALENFIPCSSYDVVLAALCDHFVPDEFFRSSMKVLKPGGGLITTYPAAQINGVVREKIYNIPATHTRFVIDGEDRLVPSHLMTEASLQELYARHGFEQICVKGIACGAHEPSETLMQAAQMIDRPLESLPILIAGCGYKPKS